MINDLVQFLQIYGWKHKSFRTEYLIHSMEQVTKGSVQNYTSSTFISTLLLPE